MFLRIIFLSIITFVGSIFPASEANIYRIQELFFKGDKNISSCLEEFQTSIFNSLENPQSHQTSLWLKQTQNGLICHYNLTESFLKLYTILKFWEQYSSQNEKVSCPQFSDVLSYIGSNYHCEEYTLWGKIKKLQQLKKSTEGFYEVLGIPSDDSDETFFGVFNKILKSLLTAPLCYQIMQGSEKEPYGGIIGKINEIIKKVQEKLNCNTLEEVMIKRKIGNFEEKNIFYPESLVTLLQNIIDNLENYRFLSLQLFKQIQSKIGFPQEIDNQPETLYSLLNSLSQILEKDQTSLMEIDQLLGNEYSKGSLIGILFEIRKILISDLFLTIGCDTDSIYSYSIIGVTKALFFKMSHEFKAIESLIFEQENALLTRIIDEAITLESAIQAPIAINIQALFDLFEIEFLKTLNEAYWFVEHSDDCHSFSVFLKKYIGTFDDAYETRTLYGILNQVRQTIFTLPLSKAFGSMQKASFFDMSITREHFCSIMTDIITILRNSESKTQNPIKNELQIEVFGHLTGSDHETICYWLNLISTILHRANHYFDFNLFQKLLQTFSLSSGEKKSLMDDLYNIKATMTEEIALSEVKNLYKIFPDVPFVLNQSGENTITKKIWDVLKQVFPYFAQQTLGEKAHQTSFKRSSSLLSHLEFLLHEEFVKKNWDVDFLEIDRQNIKSCWENVNFLIQQLQKNEYRYSEEQIFDFYEKIGSVDYPAPLTLWMDLKNLEKNLVIPNDKDIKTKKISESILQVLKSSQELYDIFQCPCLTIAKLISECLDPLYSLTEILRENNVPQRNELSLSTLEKSLFQISFSLKKIFIEATEKMPLIDFYKDLRGCLEDIKKHLSCIVFQLHPNYVASSLKDRRIKNCEDFPQIIEKLADLLAELDRIVTQNALESRANSNHKIETLEVFANYLTGIGENLKNFSLKITKNEQFLQNICTSCTDLKVFVPSFEMLAHTCEGMALILKFLRI